MNQFLSNKIIAGIVAVARLVGVGVLVSSGDTSSTTRNAALVVATPCTKPGQVTKISKQSVVCATTNSGSLWYATMKAKGKAQPCTTPGAIRKKSNIVWVCGVVKKKKLWQATRPLPPAVVASITVIEPGASQPTPALDSTQVATPETPVVADNAVLADIKIPEDKIVTQVIDDVITPPASTPPASTPPASTPPASTPPAISLACAAGGTCKVRDIGPGGGIVFYVASTPFACGEDLKAKCTYLEAAIANGTTPSTWTPTIRVQWGCYGTSVMTPAQRTASLEIGTGRANTNVITSQGCKGADNSASAASIAATYNGGNKTDWFLPSRKELDALCFAFFKGRIGVKYSLETCIGSGNNTAVTGTTAGISWSIAAGYHWSSSEDAALTAWYQTLGYGGQLNLSKIDTNYVRPVRAFSATCAAGGPCTIGDVGPGGGIVFYDAGTTQSWGRYLEAAPTDYQVNNVRTKVAWGCNSTSTGAAGLEIGTGKANTDMILTKCTTPGIAADVTNKYSTVTAAAGQWFLPSRDELNELCKVYSNGRTDTGAYSAHQRGCTGSKSPTGGFAAGLYWSSSESRADYAWDQLFSVGDQAPNFKINPYYVRPVRAF